MNQRPHLAEGETTLISGAAGTPRRGELKNINRAWPDLHLPDGEEWRGFSRPRPHASRLATPPRGITPTACGLVSGDVAMGDMLAIFAVPSSPMRLRTARVDLRM